MIPLLEDSFTKKYDVLAIQEPWRNPSAPTTYRARGTGFTLAHDKVPSRVCFYVNQNLNPNSWTVTYHSPDFYTLTLQAEQ
jgi:hypothetical protein